MMHGTISLKKEAKICLWVSVLLKYDNAEIFLNLC